MAEPSSPPSLTEKPPPSERDPFGSRHSLANLAMIVSALEDEPPDTYRLGIYATRIVALGFLFAGDALGSLISEVRQIREHVSAIRANGTRRPAKPSRTGP